MRGARLVIGDNLYMYGDVSGQPLTEDLPNAATTRKGRLRAEMAEAALAAHQAGKVKVAIGRGSDFFGPGVLNSGMGERAIRPALQGKSASLMGNIDMPTPTPSSMTLAGHWSHLANTKKRWERYGMFLMPKQ